MKNQKVLDQFNEQFNYEIESAYIYYAMASWATKEDWPGFKHYLEMQAKEELEHAADFRGFLEECGYHVTYTGMKAPKVEYTGLDEIFKDALAHEKTVTERIHKLHDLAIKEKNKGAEIFLQKYIMEQIEEEANFESLILRLERIAGSSAGLYILNNELFQRQ